jgi:hypothetical protein
MQNQSTVGTVTIKAALIRLYWFLVGNVALFILAVAIGYHNINSYFICNFLYWVCFGSLIITRYIDIRYLNERSPDGEPMTMSHWRRYVIFLSLCALSLWGIAMLAACLRGS